MPKGANKKPVSGIPETGFFHEGFSSQREEV